MANRVNVKVCGITRIEDGEVALELGAEYLGLNLYKPSPRCISLEQARTLCRHFPAGKRVFVDVATGTDELEDYADLGFDYFQIHCDLNISLATVAAWAGIVGKERLWLAPRIPPGEPFPQEILEFTDSIVLDTFSKKLYGGSGQTGNWAKFGEWATLYHHKQWMLAGGLSPDNIVEAVKQSGAMHVDVNSGVETAPGLKDGDKLRALFAALASLD